MSDDSARYRLYTVRIFTLRWEESLAFYRDLMGFPVIFADADMGWAQFQLGPATIGLERCTPEDAQSENLVGRYVGVSLEVDDIHSTYQELTDKGVPFVAPPAQQPWGGTLAHFNDPDGNTVTLLGLSE